MRRQCGVCRDPFDTTRKTAKYCSDRCRKRAQRKPGAVVAAGVLELPAEPTSESAAGPVTEATEAELAAAGRLDTALGRAALALARRIDRGDAEKGAALAALVRQHGLTLAEAVRDAKQSADPLDELRARRERKLSG